MRIDRNSPALTYGIAILSVAAVIAVRLLLWPVFGAEVPFLFFFSALAVTGWFGGFAPGILATALSSLFVASYLLPPYGDLRGLEAAHIVHFCIYVLTGLLISWLMGKLRAARALAEEAERQMEQRAAEAEEGRRTLDAMMEYIPGGVAIADASDGRIRRISNFWCDLVGRPRDAVEGAPLESLLDRRHEIRRASASDDAGMAAVPLVKALRGGEAITEQEWLLQRADGRMVPVLCSAGPIRDKGGNVDQCVISWQDITERRRMEQEMRQAHADLENRVQQRTAELARSNRELAGERQRLFALLDTLPFFVCLLDSHHSIRFANRRFHALFPETEDAASYAVLTGRKGPCAGCPACRARETNEQVQWEWASPAGRQYEVYDNPFASNGPDTLVLEIGVDITERRAAERAIQLEKDKLHDILSMMRESVYIVSRENEIEFVNPAFEREFGPLVQGRKCYEHLHGRPDSCPWCKIPDVVAGKSIESEWASPVNGKVYDVFDAPIVNHDGSISKLKMLHDITEHKRAAEALIESEKELRRLSSELLTAQEAERMRISRELHDELGQALTLVKMRVGLIEMGLADHQRQLREHCESASLHVDQAIENTRRLSRDLCPALLEDLGVTAALKRLVSDSAKASSIGILADIDNIDRLFSPQSAILLYRVVQETLTNIMKHSRATEVNISARRIDGHVVFQIQDNGVGMAPGIVESGKRTEGRGMGLPIMRERVRTLGGSLEIWSQQGIGTKLSFSVPAGGQGGLR